MTKEPELACPHEYGPSRVGHGEAQCKWCLGTNRENAIIAPNHCAVRAKKDPSWNTRTPSNDSGAGLEEAEAVEVVARAIGSTLLWDGSPLKSDAQLSDDELRDMARAAIRALSSQDSGREAVLAEALAQIAYEGPAEPWLVAHDALKGTARALSTPAPITPDAEIARATLESVWRQARANHQGYSATGDNEHDIRFFALGLTGEAGEVANFVKKRWRDGDRHDDDLRKECADVFAYNIMLADALGMAPQSLLDMVAFKQAVFVEKMRSRTPSDPIHAERGGDECHD